MPATSDTKHCFVCGRTIEWRKKWERDWDQVRYCSDRCRKQKLTPVDVQLEATILDLLASDDDWRSLMEPSRMAARRLVNQGEVVITQKGHVVDPSTAKGPIRIRLA